MSEEQRDNVEMWLKSEKESIISRVTQLEERIADLESVIIDLLQKMQ